MSDKLIQLIEDLRQSNEELVQYWKSGRDFWFNQHVEKDRLYWQEREKRLEAEYLLKEYEDAAR